MTLSRNQLIAGATGAIALVGVGMFIGRGSSHSAPLTPVKASAPLTTGAVSDVPPQIKATVDTLARGAALWTFFHEAGHMVIHELNLPSTGPGEDAADEFATFALTEAVKQAPDDQKGLYANIVMSGAWFWKLVAIEYEKKGLSVPYFDEHPPEIRRYASILCLATGADPVRFIPIAYDDKFSQDRLLKCADEYKTRHAAWDTLFAPHKPGVVSKIFGGHRLKLVVGPVQKAEWQGWEDMYTQGGYFQQILDALSSQVSLPRDIPVVIKGCGVLNAWYTPSEHQITLCYDWNEHHAEVFARQLLAEAAVAAGQQNGGQPPPAQPGPPPTPDDLTPSVQALSGVWSCQVRGGQQQVSLTPDGLFTAALQTPSGSFSAWGRWSLADANTMRYDYEGPAGMSTPELVRFTLPSPNLLETQNGSCRRIR